ncbi:MAG: MFS transporter, partial [Gemmatimonadota bacterium]
APARARPSMREALQFVLNPGWPRTLVILSATYTIFAMSFLTILPVYARDALGLGAAGYGWLTAAFGVGAAGGALLLAGFGPTRARGNVALRAGVVIGSAILLLSIAPVAPLAFLLLVAAGASLSTNAITTNTLLQTEAPDELRGHVIGFYAFIVVGLAPFGALQVGLVSEFAGVRVAVALGGIICLAMTLWMTFQIRGTLGGAIDRRKSAQTEESYSWQERRQ